MFTFESNIASFYPYALKGQKLLAQGSALGILAFNKTPCKGKSFVYCLLIESFCPFRATGLDHKNPGRCPGLGASALSGRVGNYFTSDFTLPSANLVSMMSPAFSCEAERMLLPSFSVML